jgi:hypothetical protein
MPRFQQTANGVLRKASCFSHKEALALIELIAILAAMLLPALAKAEQSSNEELDKRAWEMFCDSVIKVDSSWQLVCNNGGDNTRPPKVHDRADYCCCQIPRTGVS